jgi:hypothetical protein
MNMTPAERVLESAVRLCIQHYYSGDWLARFTG